MLVDILTPAARKIVYAVYAVAVFLLGAVQVGYSSAGQGQPTWLTVALSVAAFVGTAIGAVAASNTPALTEWERLADEEAEASRVASLDDGPDHRA